MKPVGVFGLSRCQPVLVWAGLSASGELVSCESVTPTQAHGLACVCINEWEGL